VRQARGEGSVYHGLPGLATTTLSAELQSSGVQAAGVLLEGTLTSVRLLVACVRV
jgi:hypothetical protein